MKPMKTIKDGWNKFTVVVKDKDYSTRGRAFRYLHIPHRACARNALLS